MYKNVLKKILDLILALIILPFFVILFLVISLLIKIDDKGPVIYAADRLGKNTKPFKMYKFRTMKVNSPDLRNPDGSTFNSDNDPRLTRVGKILRKTSLDELPQLINVLKMNMSFIGPRPDLSSQVLYYNLDTETKFKVSPGITGYAQVNGRNELTWEEKLKLDREYVKKISLLLDIKILIKTFVKVLKKEGVNKNEK